MPNISSFLEEELLDHVFKNNAYTSPASVYVGLVDSNGTDAELEAGTLTNEITGYTGDRKAITFDAISQVGGKGTTQNSADIDFESMPAVTVAYAIICDAATGGNILFWCPLDTNRTTAAGDTLRISAGDLTIDLD